MRMCAPHHLSNLMNSKTIGRSYHMFVTITVWASLRTPLTKLKAHKIWSRDWTRKNRSLVDKETQRLSLNKIPVRSNWNQHLTKQILTASCLTKRSMLRTNTLTFTITSAKSKSIIWVYNKCTPTVWSCSRSLTRLSIMMLATRIKQSLWALPSTAKNFSRIRILLSSGVIKTSHTTARRFHR